MNKICAVLIGKFKDKFKVVLLDFDPRKFYFYLSFSKMIYQIWGLCLLRLRKIWLLLLLALALSL